MLDKLRKINDNNFNIFSLIYVFNLFKYIIIGITFLTVILSFILYGFLKKEYYKLSINVKSSYDSEISGFIDVPSIISENFNVLLGMVLSSSATRNMGINLPPFHVPKEITEKINKFEKFIFLIKDSKAILEEIKNNNLLDDFKNIDIKTVINYLSNLTVAEKSEKKIIINFTINDNINTDVVDLIITAGLNMILRDIAEESNNLKNSITKLMEVITEQYFIDLKNHVEVLEEYLLIAKNNKEDLELLLGNNFLKLNELDFYSNSDFQDLDNLSRKNKMKIFISPYIIANEIEAINNRQNHEAFIPGKSILKSTFYLINSNLPAQKIQQSLSSPGYKNDNFKFMLFKSPDLKDIIYYKTDLNTYLLIGLSLGLFFGIFITLMIYIYQSEKKNFINN